MKLRKLQVARRLVQLTVVLVILAIPAIARYANYLSARELDKNLLKWEGTLPGRTLTVMDKAFRALPAGERERADRIERNRAQVLAYAKQIHGGPWSAQIGLVSMTDPLAAAESVAASKRIVKVLLIGLIIPVLATLLLGRVFCSWICPMHLFLEMTDKLRRVLKFLELHPRDVKFSRSVKYVLLGAGIVVTAILARPVLGYVYPPAIIGREAHDLVFGIFDRAEFGKQGWWFGGLTWMSLIIAGIALFEVIVSRRWWCRYVCPGGALYSLLGSKRAVRIKLEQVECTHCAECVRVCPMGLNPMNNQFGRECDNCGLCLSSCDDKALMYETVAGKKKFTLPILLALFVAVPVAQAHHILGLPHYAYDEKYPQTPVLTYRVNTGPYELKVTGYPGQPKPGERVAVHVYLQHLQTGDLFPGEVTFTAFRKHWIGSDTLIYGPVATEVEQAVFKFFPTFPEESEYLLRVYFEAEDAPWTIDLPMVVGEPGSPWMVVGGVAAGVVLFLIVIRAVRIKQRRAHARLAHA